jgi:transposase InsO family protein
VEHARERHELSERHACRLVNQWRGTQRYQPIQRVDEDALTQGIITLAGECGRYGYRRITALSRTAGWRVGKDRVQRIWRREGLKIPQKQRPRRRLWFNDGSCVRLRPERANHEWSYDFVSAMTHDGRTMRMLTMIDEYTRECLAIRVARRLESYEVIEALADVMLWRGVPENIRSDNGPEFVAAELRKWLGNLGTGTLYIGPGSPWENGYCESFNGKLRDECLNGEIFYSPKEAQLVIEKWRVEYNTRRPLGTGLQAAGASGVRAANGSSPVAYGSLQAAICLLARRGCDVNSLTRRGTKSRSDHWPLLHFLFRDRMSCTVIATRFEFSFVRKLTVISSGPK